MSVRFLPLLGFSAAIALCPIASAGEISFPRPATSDDLAFPLGNARLGTLTAGKTDTEILPLLENPKSPAIDPAKPGAGFTGTKLGELRFQWLDADKEVTGYQRKLDLANGIAVTTFKRGTAGFTWTSFMSTSDDLLVLHLRTDKPGFLSFRVRLQQGETPAKVEDRRVLALPTARAWIYPMESEVTPGDSEITVRGEGEALILIAATSDPEMQRALPDRLKALGFGGKEHPDVFAVWNGLLERQRRK